MLLLAKSIRQLGALFAVALAALSTVLASSALAGVNLKNGNFYITYTDLIVGHPEFEVSRTYNSLSSQVLSFGLGWGTDLDTSLSVNGDGSVTVTENGSGATRVYFPPDRSAAELDRLIDDMLNGMERAGWFASDQDRADMRVQLEQDADLRRYNNRRLVADDFMQPTEIAIGERLRSPSQPGVELVREAGGFYRRSRTGFELFNLDGQLLESAFPGELSFRLRRDAAGHLREITTEGGTTIQVETNSDGQITRLQSGGSEAVFAYNDARHLISATNAANTTFRYEYDAKGNMTAILYEDGSSIRHTYDADSGWITSARNREGLLTTYEYGDYEISEPRIVDHFYTQVDQYDADDNLSRSSLYAYRIGVDDFGNNFTAGITTVVNGVETDTRYDGECNTPTRIRRGNQETVFEYNAKCLLTYKRTDEEEIKLEYHPRHDKITFVSTTDLRYDETLESRYSYDIQGNLIDASNSDGQSVALVYDGKNRIVSVTDQDDQTLAFTYNEIDKPIHIEIEGVGAIDVEYDSSGEISGVESEQGHEMALRVTQAFQVLLSIVKPAGVNLNI